MMRSRRTIQRIAGIVLIAPLFVAVPLAYAQTGESAAPTEPPGPIELGGYTLSGRGNALRIMYDAPGSLPIGTLVDVAAPEAQTRLATGPVGSALSAVGYPGPVILGLEALLVQGGFESPLPIPEYPLAVQAISSGPTEVRDDTTVPGASMYAHAEGPVAEATTKMPGADLAPLLSYSGMTATSRSVVGATAATETMVKVSDVAMLGGVLQIDSIISELRATSNGVEGETTGGIRYVEASFLGQPVEIDAEGIHLADPAPDAEDPTGGLLDPLLSQLGPLASQLAPLNSAVADLIDQFGSLNELLGQAGITIRLADPRATGTGASAERVTEGLTIEFEQELGAGPLGDIFDLVPLLPNIPGAPVGPNDLIQLLQAKQVSSISLGRAEVAATASPAFEAPPFETNIDTLPATSSPAGNGFAPSNRPAPSPTSDPLVPAPAEPDEVATGPIVSGNPLSLPGVIGPGVIFAALVGGLLLSLGTRKLPDWAIDGTVAAGTACDPSPLPRGDQ